MSKPIPKFLHTDLKELIGKRNPTQDDVSKLLELVFTTQYDWTERVIQYVNVHYSAASHATLSEMLSDAGELEDFIEAWQMNEVQECISIIANAVDRVEDDLHDNRWDYGDEVDRDYLEEEFEDTIDSDYETYSSTRQQGSTWMGDQISGYELSNSGQSHKFVWRNIVNWFANRRNTPMNDGPHSTWINQRNDQESDRS